MTNNFQLSKKLKFIMYKVNNMYIYKKKYKMNLQLLERYLITSSKYRILKHEYAILFLLITF